MMFIYDNMNSHPDNIFEKTFKSFKSKIPSFTMPKPKISSNTSGGFTEIMEMFK